MAADRPRRWARQPSFKAASPCKMEAIMRPSEVVTEHFSQAEKLRRLRLQLAKTSDEPQRHVILRQIEELEDEAKIQLKSQR